MPGIGGAAAGGGLYLSTGTTKLSGNDITYNTATGGEFGSNGGQVNGPAAPGALAQGGGVALDSASLTSTGDDISHNTAQGGSGGSVSPNGVIGNAGDAGGDAQGGGVFDNTSASISLTGDTVGYNKARGGNGFSFDAPTTDYGSGPAGAGGAGQGGGFYGHDTGMAEFLSGSITKNQAVGGTGGQSIDGSGGGPGGPAQGGGLYNDAGAMDCQAPVSGNKAQGGNGGNGGSATSSISAAGAGGGGGNGSGGGLFISTGSVDLEGATFATNTARGGPGGKGGDAPASANGGGAGGPAGAGSGGGIFDGDLTLGASGSLFAEYSTFTGNTATAGQPGAGGTDAGTPAAPGSAGSAGGGGVFIYGAGGAIVFTNDTFASNTAQGGQGLQANSSFVQGGAGGVGQGGGLFLVNGNGAEVTESTFNGNQAIGGQGGDGAEGGSGLVGGGGWGGEGGAGQGGGILVSAADLSLTNDTLASNLARGGQGGTGGSDMYMHEFGGDGGEGGDGEGGGIYAAFSSVSLLNVTVAGSSPAAKGTPTPGNQASGGAGGDGGRGQGYFGSGNGNPGKTGNGTAGGLYDDGVNASMTLTNTLVAGNVDDSGNPDVFGPFNDGDFNLIGNTTGSSSFVGSNDVLNPATAGLDVLNSYGGFTDNMLLLPGSPALNAANTAAAPATDQRGVTRPQGPAADIGAVEDTLSFQSVPPRASGALPIPGKVGQRYHQRLVVRLTENGRPLAGVVVTFTLLPSPGGAGGTLGKGSAAGGPTVTVTTDARGEASVSVKANSVVGTFTVTASVPGVPMQTFALDNVAGIVRPTTFRLANARFLRRDSRAPGDQENVGSNPLDGLAVGDNALAFLQAPRA
jgi:hypothetical protein